MTIKTIKPLFNGIVTTANKYVEPSTIKGTDLIDLSKSKNALDEYQKVVAVGEFIKNIKVGDLVCINPSRFAELQHNKGSLKNGIIKDNPVIKYKFKFVQLSGVDHLMLTDRDIDYVVEEYDD